MSHYRYDAESLKYAERERAHGDIMAQYEVNDRGVDVGPVDPTECQRTCRACGWGGYDYLLVKIGVGLPWCFCPDCGDYVT